MLDASVVENLLQTSTATVSTQLLKRGLRNTFLQGLHPMNPTHARFVGEAFTLRFIPSREDIDVMEMLANYAHPQRKAIETIEPGQVLIIDSRQEVRASSLGDILITRLIKRGAASLVTDGSLRDSPEIRKMNFPAFAAAVSASNHLVHHHAADMQVPIGCAGVAVYPGDVLFGDEEGVICIPQHFAAEVAAASAEQERLERFILSKIQQGAPLRGTYPANEATLEEYQIYKSRHTERRR